MSNRTMPVTGPGPSHEPLLVVNLQGLNDDQQEALRRMVDKFIAGCQEHGQLDITSKRWGPELFSEIIDSNFYLMFELMRMERDGTVREAKRVEIVKALTQASDRRDWDEVDHLEAELRNV